MRIEPRGLALEVHRAGLEPGEFGAAIAVGSAATMSNPTALLSPSTREATLTGSPMVE